MKIQSIRLQIKLNWEGVHSIKGFCKIHYHIVKWFYSTWSWRLISFYMEEFVQSFWKEVLPLLGTVLLKQICRWWWTGGLTEAFDLQALAEWNGTCNDLVLEQILLQLGRDFLNRVSIPRFLNTHVQHRLENMTRFMRHVHWCVIEPYPRVTYLVLSNVGKMVL